MSDVKEPLQELFEGISTDILTPDVQLKLATLFESSLNSAIEAKEVELEESNKAELETFKEDLVSQTDEYLKFFTSQYIQENEQVIEDFSKVRLAEKVLRNFQQMTEAFNISLAEDSISNEDELDDLKVENTKLINKLIESKKEVENIKKAAMISEAHDKLETEVQKEALTEMARKFDFDQDLFEGQLSVMVEKILKPTEKTAEKLEEKLDETIVTKPSSDISKYLGFMNLKK